MQARPNVTVDAIQAPQLRAARGLLGWSQERLATASGVPKRTIARLELAETAPQRRTSAAIRAALEAAGVEFIDENGGGPGVRLRRGGQP
jgi:transcriptional regulator with XRE-family HTH domain